MTRSLIATISVMSLAVAAVPTWAAVPLPNGPATAEPGAAADRREPLHEASAMFGLASEDRVRPLEEDAPRTAVAPPDWKRRMVRTCVRSGDKVNC